MRRLLLSVSTIALVTAFIAPAAAYGQQSINLWVGGFVPRGEDARPRDDVLVNNLRLLDFDIKDFNGATVGGEWLAALGDWLDAGVGLGLYSKTVSSRYTGFVNANGLEIEQDLKLRVVPFTATVRFLPLGHNGPIQPYIGAGVGVFRWRYSETGEFVDFSDDSVFRDRFVGSGSAVGPVVLGGARFPIGGSAVGGEIRYQSAEGDLPNNRGFSGATIDLSGISYLLTFNIRF